MLPKGYEYLGQGSSGHVFRVPAGGECGEDVALKISVLRGLSDMQQAVRESSLCSLLPPCPGLALTTEVWATWVVPEKFGLQGFPDLDAGLPQLFLLQGLPLAKGESLYKICKRVSNSVTEYIAPETCMMLVMLINL